MSEPNAFEPAWDVELPDAPFMARAMRLGVRAGARELGATLYEIEPGGTNAPYHAHHGNDIPFAEAVAAAIRAAPEQP